MDARKEAANRLGNRFDVRVLEPSPPAITAGPWFADDPVAFADGVSGLPTVSPVTGADRTWDEMASDDPDLAPWCAARWLGAWGRLPDYPADAAATRVSLHALAEYVVAPSRYRVNGKIGLRFTRSGFGTPFFGADKQVRVEKGLLVVQEDGVERRADLTTLTAAADFVDVECYPPADVYEPATAPDIQAPLDIDPGAAEFFGEWFGFAASVLEEFRALSPASAACSRVQIWPEHFDMSMEAGDESRGKRATYGASPGDAHHAQPYLYVAPWAKVPAGDCWNDDHFDGACLPLDSFKDAMDQRGEALDFFRGLYRTLHEEDVAPEEA
ncbi:MAG: hypothetical protein QOH90_1919 [Actinomycetota bacterium]|nr:hypothetical protein [Actinomycetota bacterium]